MMPRSVYNRPVLDCSSDIQYLKPGVHIIHSPNYDRDNPQDYGNNYRCTYKLQPADQKGRLRFDCFFFQLEDSRYCKNDVLKVVIGIMHYAFCGRDKPHFLIADKFDITFKTDSTITDKGFLCTVMSMTPEVGPGSLPCGTHNVGPGTYPLLSQNYPNHYGRSIYCRWELIPKGSSLKMYFSCSDFDMISWDNSCEWDWMKVSGVHHCNNNKPAPLQLMGTVLIVRYSTPDIPNTKRRGFNCTLVVR